jgi:hypothetical protein
MEPRVYLYKTTFEEIPDWYWGAHKEKKYGDGYLGSPDTHAWKWDFYTPILEILEFFPYTEEGWVEALKVEKRCIKPDLNNPLCLNEHCGGLLSLEACRRGAKKAAKKTNEEKDNLGRSTNAVRGGEKSKRSKPVIAINRNGGLIVFSSIISCANEFGVKESAVRKWIRKERFPKGNARGWNFALDG